MKQNLFPLVYWAQTEDNISLKVDLKEVKVKKNILIYAVLILIDFISHFHKPERRFKD
jgi:hypothetical protein